MARIKQHRAEILVLASYLTVTPGCNHTTVNVEDDAAGSDPQGDSTSLPDTIEPTGGSPTGSMSVETTTGGTDATGEMPVASTSGGSSTSAATEGEAEVTSSAEETSGSSGEVASQCGDGVLDPGEVCDDGNSDEEDACLDECVPASCGDGHIQASVEECDPGSSGFGHGCEPDCRRTIRELDVGNNYSCVRSGSAKVQCWGRNMWGELGLGHVENLGDQLGEVPTDPVGLGDMPLAGLTIGSEGGHTCVLLEGGSVRCWGRNNRGQLGVGDNNDWGDALNELNPPEAELDQDVTHVAAGFNHTCAVTVPGEVLCWGRNDHGQLGLGHTQDLGDNPDEMPPPVVELGGAPVAMLALGARHSCALMEAGEVRCWGQNNRGQLGLGHANDLGDNPDEMPPDPVLLGDEAVVSIAAGSHHTCALFESGSARCWGDNSAGALGIDDPEYFWGDELNETQPKQAHLGGAVVRQLALGNDHTCAVLQSGDAMCWGYNYAGQLGLDSTVSWGDGDPVMPPPIVHLNGENVAWIAAGSFHNCALMKSGGVRCWGINNQGGLGLGTTETWGDGVHPMPPPPVDLF